MSACSATQFAVVWCSVVMLVKNMFAMKKATAASNHHTGNPALD